LTWGWRVGFGLGRGGDTIRGSGFFTGLGTDAMPYLFLALAIVCEVVATSALKASESFTRRGPVLVVVVGYGLAFYFLSRCLGKIPVGVAYAVWSGAGLVLISVVGAVVYRQLPDRATVLGMGLILAGVVVLHLGSRDAVAE
jgi:small multidrug resistance pump